MLQKTLSLMCAAIAAFTPFVAAAQTAPARSTNIAVYDGLPGGDFLQSWWLAGPIQVNRADSTEPSSDQQHSFFKTDRLSRVEYRDTKPEDVKLDGHAVPWVEFSAPGRAINLDSIFGQKDFAAAYAVCQVTVQEPKDAMLMVGSDDAVRIWHNGTLVHDNWVARALTADEDLVAVHLTKGVNQFLVMVQDVQQGWGFTARFADKEALDDRLRTAAGNGQLEAVATLLQNGANPDMEGASGFSALGMAEYKGRSESAALLRKNGATKSLVPSPDQVIDHYYSSVSGKEAPGIAVLVAQDGKVLVRKGFGDADIEAGKVISPATKFRIGSITKQFTAAAILKLQEQGKLNVQDKLSKYFPDFPRGEEVTVHHLLTHTSGIHSYTNKNDFVSKVTAPITPTELYKSFVNDPYDFSPGEEFRYNNSGYFLLGMIVEKAGKMEYGEFLAKTFFTPLKMNDTGIHSSSLRLTNEATGYAKENGIYTKAVNWDMSWAGAAGAMYSTVDDLHKWNEALYGGKVLSEASMKAALTPVTLNHGAEPVGIHYGYGLFFGEYRGHEVISHGGGLHGFISQLAWYPEDRMTVVMLTNLTPSELNMDPNNLAEAFLYKSMEGQSSYAAIASNDPIADFAGRYDFKEGRVMIITAEGKDLFAQLSGQARFPIFPSAPGEYFWKVVEAKIKFVKDENGKVTHGHFEQGGFIIDAVRLEDQKIITVDPALFERYTGKYDFGNGVELTVTVDQGKLFIQATNQPRFEIQPVSETVFTARELNASVTFDEASQGKSKKLLVDLGGRKTEALRIVE